MPERAVSTAIDQIATRYRNGERKIAVDPACYAEYCDTLQAMSRLNVPAERDGWPKNEFVWYKDAQIFKTINPIASRSCCDLDDGEFAVVCGNAVIFCRVNDRQSSTSDRVVLAINRGEMN